MKDIFIDPLVAITRWPTTMPVLTSKDFCKGTLVDQYDSDGKAVSACLMGWAIDSFGMNTLEVSEEYAQELISENPTSPFAKFILGLAGEKIGTKTEIAHDYDGNELIGLDGHPVEVTVLDRDVGEIAVTKVTSFNDMTDRAFKRLSEKWNRTIEKFGYVHQTAV